MKTICVIINSIEEWVFLKSTIFEFSQNKKIDLKIVATGKLLSPDYGLLYENIEKEIKIDKKIEMYPKLDTSVSNANSLSLAIMGFANYFNEVKPYKIIISGNSYSILGACISALISKIEIENIQSDKLLESTIPNQFLNLF
ncbi:UDP-N-acetylglucosamine 2-epimerase [Aliarcobacter cryaerophilus]|uniref:UDP-N-acetylglucosamine 2-epimerase domain-containing protein n=1 Tax=Aliarcobacter cryaerophilus TaxID=28198 RepID=A0A2S9T7F9_9BACT|nr:UDP-N-acetylglucosamine 2-epimerase [Aliarcobacter cryaerophilus]PRM94739.1 hypothetical protein CJ670_09820 [Arcobacter cryaerophilus gv. crypticus]